MPLAASRVPWHKRKKCGIELHQGKIIWECYGIVKSS